MFSRHLLFVFGALICVTGSAKADRPYYCNPPGAHVREILSECNRPQDAAPIKTPLLPTDLVLRAAACDVGNAALASRGNKLPIDKINFSVEVDYKEVTTTSDTFSAGATGISPFNAGISGEGTEASSITTEHNYSFEPLPPAALVATYCNDTGYKRGRRSAKYSRWLQAPGSLTRDVSIYRQGTLGQGKVSYSSEFGATNSLKTGFNIQFLLVLAVQDERSRELTHGVKVTFGRAD